jgi:hypothetical protein
MHARELESEFNMVMSVDPSVLSASFKKKSSSTLNVHHTVTWCGDIDEIAHGILILPEIGQSCRCCLSAVQGPANLSHRAGLSWTSFL